MIGGFSSVRLVPVPVEGTEREPNPDILVLGQFVDQDGVAGEIKSRGRVVKFSGRPDVDRPVVDAILVQIIPVAICVYSPVMDVIVE